MPKTSNTKRSNPKKLHFHSESEEAEWYHTKAGREHAKRMVQKAIRKGKLVVEEKLTPREAAALAKKTGKRIILRNGSDVKRTDPAVLQKLWKDAIASMTKAVSLRLPLGDIEAAKALAAQKGTGYQTVLKELIHEGLRRAS